MELRHFVIHSQNPELTYRLEENHIEPNIKVLTPLKS